MAAAHAHMMKIGAIPPDEPGEAEAVENPAIPAEEQQEAQSGRQLDVRLRVGAQPRRRVEREPDFFI